MWRIRTPGRRAARPTPAIRSHRQTRWYAPVRCHSNWARRIDYIMIRSGIHGPTLDVVDCRGVLSKAVAGVWASDHFGAMADLEVPTHVPGTWEDGRAPHSHRVGPRLRSSP